MRRLRAHRGSGRPATLVAICLLLVSTLIAPCLAHAVTAVNLLERRDTNNGTIPDPIIFAPNQNWEGIDGQWNTFSLQIGEPSQWVRVLISTASQQTWAVFSDHTACNASQQSTDISCFDSRGRTFNTSTSSSWHEIGYYSLWLEANLGYSGNGFFGYDTVGLGLPGNGGPTIKNTTVGTIITKDFWLGHFGLHVKPTNFTAFDNPSPSYMTYLFQQNLIPSLSFGYTAGAQYRFTTVLASLTLGGYDASRFVPNDLTFTFAPDNERDIVVGVVDIRANGALDTNVDLLKRDSFDMYIDSTVSELWLPIEVCNAFEDTFGLEYNNDTDLYLVNDTMHQNLLARNASITFSLGQKSINNATVDITLPYAAFDLEARPPYRNLADTMNYFPIRRAANATRFVLGRTFLQEAYLTVDWERQNFSISQCTWVFDQDTDIVPIVSSKYRELATTSHTKHLSSGAIIGIAIGCGFIFALIVCGVMGWFWRKRHRRNLAWMKAEIEESKATAAAAVRVESLTREAEDPPTSPIADSEEGTNVIPKAELPADDSFARLEMDTDVKDGEHTMTFDLPSPAVEVENTDRQIFEMPGDIPVRQEADGRQLSEKESMMVRERIYNGVDPNEAQTVSPPLEEHQRRPLPLLPSDVALVNTRLPVSPVTPLMPQTPRDGSHLEASDTFFQPSARTPRDGRFLGNEETLLYPISPLEDSTDTSRRRFSYES